MARPDGAADLPGSRSPLRPVRDRRPLSVQVYDRLIGALEADGARPGDVIPPEIELAGELGVSRTVLREALRLLEEDGVLQRGRDPRRRHLASPVRVPAGFHAPLEDILQVAGELTVQPVRTEVLPATSWSAGLLDVAVGTALLCWESVLVAGDEPLGSALELVPHGDPAVDAVTATAGTGPQRAASTLLRALGPQFRSRLAPLMWRLAPDATRATRGGLERVPRGAALNSLTTVIGRNGRPVYLAKHVLRLDRAVLAVGSGSSPDGTGPQRDDLADLSDAELAGAQAT